MLKRCRLLALFLGLSLCSLGQGQSPAKGDKERIADLVNKLGSSKYGEREKAFKELEALGQPALEALREAAKSGTDLETTRRAGDLVRKIEEKVLTASILAPKRVRLNFHDEPALDAVKQLAKQSGYLVLVDGDHKAVAQRKVSLETGEVTFWEALDQLCAKAGLVERVTTNTTGVSKPYSPRPLPRNFKPVKGNPAPAPPQAQPAPPQPAQPQPAQPQPAQPQVAPLQAAQPKVPAAPPKANGIKVQPAQVQLQLQSVVGPTTVVVQGPSQIRLMPGSPQAVPTCYAGAVRLRLVPPSAGQLQAKTSSEFMLVLDVAAEPRLQNFTLVGQPRFDKVLDDQGQALTVLLDDVVPANPNAVGNVPMNAAAVLIASSAPRPQREVLFRIKQGDKSAKTLKEVTGSVTAKVTLPAEPLIVVDDILNSQGQAVKGKHGGSVQIQNVEKLDGGKVRIKLALENVPGPNNNMPGAIQIIGGGGVQIQGLVIGSAGGRNTGGVPDLEDEKGRKFEVVQVPQRSLRIQNGTVSQEFTIVYAPTPEMGDAARLVLRGQRDATIQVPFLFDNVPVK